MIIGTAHQFSVYTANKVLNITPYRYGFYIDYILPVEPLNPNILRQKQVYQSIVDCINWLTNCTNPAIAPALTFLDLYSNATHSQQYKAAVNALK